MCLIRLYRPAVYIYYFKQRHAVGWWKSFKKPQMCMSIVGASGLPANILFNYFFSVKEIDPTNNDAKMKLAEVYESMNEPRKALELVYEGSFMSLRPKQFPPTFMLHSHRLSKTSHQRRCCKPNRRPVQRRICLFI